MLTFVGSLRGQLCVASMAMPGRDSVPNHGAVAARIRIADAGRPGTKCSPFLAAE